MFKSYLKTAWRSLLRHKGASLIKLSGLAIGMACCMLILVYINDELSYNAAFANAGDIYRVNFVKHGDGETRIMAGSTNAVGPAIEKDVPQVAAVGRLYSRSGILEVKDAGAGVKRFQEAGIYFADEGTIGVFGVKGADLRAPNSIHLPEKVGVIHKLWDHYFPERIFEYSFLDENINALYQAQENLSRLVRYFALIAIFISCTGLFALASFMAAQRTREIGIRKVLGASVASLVVLLFRDFLRLVLLALFISIPLAWWVMNKWLHDFAYRISLTWWIFAAAGLLAVAITFLTVGMQGLRVVRVSPVKSLRNE